MQLDIQPDVLISSGDTNFLLASAIHRLLTEDNCVGSVSLMDDDEAALQRLRDEDIALVIALVDVASSSNFLARLGRAKKEGTRLILIFNAADNFAIFHLSRFPVDGLISTKSSYEELKVAIHTVQTKKLKYISPALISATTRLFNQQLPFAHLSKKELDVVKFIVNGKRNIEIAAELSISHKTVSTYKSKIYRKLEVNSDVELVIYVQKMALLTPQSPEGLGLIRAPRSTQS